MVNVTHMERGPWARIRDEGRGNNTRIPYALAVPDDDQIARLSCKPHTNARLF